MLVYRKATVSRLFTKSSSWYQRWSLQIKSTSKGCLLWIFTDTSFWPKLFILCQVWLIL